MLFDEDWRQGGSLKKPKLFITLNVKLIMKWLRKLFSRR